MKKGSISPKVRAKFTASKVVGALKWIVVSGVATYALIELSKFVDLLQLAKEYSTLIYMIINILTFAIAKYVEGEDK